MSSERLMYVQFTSCVYGEAINLHSISEQIYLTEKKNSPKISF